MTGTLLIALAITLALEVPIVALAYPGERRRMGLICALVTTSTNLTMNAWLIHSASAYETHALIGELAATGLEAVAYVATSRLHLVGQALIASGLANAASYAAGLVLL